MSYLCLASSKSASLAESTEPFYSLHGVRRLAMSVHMALYHAELLTAVCMLQ